MKKLIVNISDFTYEKLRFEAMQEKKSIQEIIQQRILYKKFDDEVEEAFEYNMQKQFENLTKDS